MDPALGEEESLVEVHHEPLLGAEDDQSPAVTPDEEDETNVDRDEPTDSTLPIGDEVHDVLETHEVSREEVHHEEPAGEQIDLISDLMFMQIK